MATSNAFASRRHVLRALLLLVCSRTCAVVDAKAAKNSYDSHGCCTSCGYQWCEKKSRCIEEWASCDTGFGDLAKCKFSWAGLTWDLSPLRDAHRSYEITDIFSHPGQNYTYVFGICQDVETTNDWVAEGGKCESTKGSASSDVMTAPSAGYQIYQQASNGYSECNRLSGSLADESDDATAVDDDDTIAAPHGASSVEWGLTDPMNPAEGMYIQYTGGNTCKDTVTEKQQCTDKIDGVDYCRRTLRINFMCNNRIKDIPTREDIKEARGCEYVMTLNSQYGCPTECPRASSDGAVCYNRGICAYDGVEDGKTLDGLSGRVSCLCEQPWGGTSCKSVLDYASPQTSEHNPLFWFGLLTLFVGIGVVAGSRRQQLVALFSGTADLVRTSSIMKGDVEVPRFTGSSFAGSSAPPGAAVRAGGPSYQQQEHQRFLEDDGDDADDAQTFSL